MENLMKRVQRVLIGVIAFFAAASMVSCGKEKAETKSDNVSVNDAVEPVKPVVLRMADNHAEDYPTVMGDKYFAKLVEERTDGRVKIEVYHGGQLGDEPTTIEQVSAGVIDFVRVSISPLTQINDKYNVLMLPYLYKDRSQYFKVLDGPVGDEFLKLINSRNMEGLCWFDSGSRNFYNSKRAVKTPDDLKGLKIRVQKSELMMGLVEAVGASPTPMSFGEVYSALQTGVIDGAENNFPSYDSTSHYEAAKYFTIDEHTRVPEMVIVNLDSLKKLSEKDQKTVREAAKEAAKKQREYWLARVEQSRRKMADAGNIITGLSAEEKKAFQDKVYPLYKKFAGNYMNVVDKILATR